MITRLVLLLIALGSLIGGYYLLSVYQTYRNLILSGRNADEFPSRFGISIIDFPEEMEFTTDNPASVIEKLLKQAKEMFRYDPMALNISLNQLENKLFFIETNSSDLNVISFARSGQYIPFQRAEMITPCISPKHLYDFLVSVEGYELIDPVNENILLSSPRRSND